MKTSNFFKLNLHFYILMLMLVCGNKIQKKVFRFDRYDICEVGPSKPFNVSYIIIKPAGYGSVVDGQYEIFKDMDQIKVTAKITKCARKELLDSCEYVTTINTNNICGYLAQKNSLMSPMIYNHHPPLTCPIKKGTMVLRNGSFDPSLVNIFPLENFYWKLEILFYKFGTGEYLYKMCIEGQVVAYREESII